jgi:hypothetical protein
MLYCKICKNYTGVDQIAEKGKKYRKITEEEKPRNLSGESLTCARSKEAILVVQNDF